MYGVRMTCGEDVHTWPGVVDNCHAAVDKAFNQQRRSRINQRFNPQTRQFARSCGVGGRS